MKTWISMLRGINVSGQKKIKMADLRAFYEGLGFGNVRSYVQSGNVIFESEVADSAELETTIHDMIEKQYGFDVPVMVRPVTLFERVIAENPYLEKAKDTKHLYVGFLSAEPDPALIDAIDIPRAQNEEFSIDGQVLYFYCPGQYGRTKLSNNFFEKKLKVRATTRNWRSVTRIYELATT